jgi:hypothetical protein
MPSSSSPPKKLGPAELAIWEVESQLLQEPEKDSTKPHTSRSYSSDSSQDNGASSSSSLPQRMAFFSHRPRPAKRTRATVRSARSRCHRGSAVQERPDRVVREPQRRLLRQ